MNKVDIEDYTFIFFMHEVSQFIVKNVQYIYLSACICIPELETWAG